MPGGGPAGPHEHGGGLDAAIARWGGERADWIDLSTGINRVPYPIPNLPAGAWTDLPDCNADDRLLAAARTAWNVPDEADIIAAPGGSALIARLPGVIAHRGTFAVDSRSYGEWRAAFAAAGWTRTEPGHESDMHVEIHVHPDNPTGRYAPRSPRRSTAAPQ